MLEKLKSLGEGGDLETKKLIVKELSRKLISQYFKKAQIAGRSATKIRFTAESSSDSSASPECHSLSFAVAGGHSRDDGHSVALVQGEFGLDNETSLLAEQVFAK